jgi:hypothetical protein
VSDRNQPDDPLIRNGRSCIACHFAGTKSFRDDVRPAIQQQGSNDLGRVLGTIYMRPELLENALRSRADFQSLDIVIVKDSKAADLIINLDRPFFTFDFTYSVTHRQSSILVAGSKVTAFNGKGAVPKIAKELIKQMQAARLQQ